MRRNGRRVVRWFLVGTGPLARRTDRVERAFRWLLVLAVLATVPVALPISSALQHRAVAQAARQAATRHAVHAVVLTDPQVPDASSPDVVVPTAVGWTTATGKHRTATVPVPVTDRADDRVVVWLAPNGDVTSPPLDREEASANATVLGFLAGLCVPLAAWALLWGARLVLNARRSRHWQADWQAVEPLWTSR
jgi:hypothetical protein